MAYNFQNVDVLQQIEKAFIETYPGFFVDRQATDDTLNILLQYISSLKSAPEMTDLIDSVDLNECTAYIAMNGFKGEEQRKTDFDTRIVAIKDILEAVNVEVKVAA